MGLEVMAAAESVTLSGVVDNFKAVLTGAGEGIFGFVDKVVESPVLLLTCVLLPIALTLGSFAIGMLRR